MIVIHGHHRGGLKREGHCLFPRLFKNQRQIELEPFFMVLGIFSIMTWLPPIANISLFLRGRLWYQRPPCVRRH